MAFNQMAFNPPFIGTVFYCTIKIKIKRAFFNQVCDICDSTNEAKKHPPEYAVDGMETWWQTPPLSRGMKYNEVNLTIDLGQASLFDTF